MNPSTAEILRAYAARRYYGGQTLAHVAMIIGGFLAAYAASFIGA